MMMRLVAVAKAVENAQSLFLARLFHVHRLETTGERGIFLKMLAVFLGSGGANYLQLAARQRWFQNGGSVDGAFGRTRANDGMHFVDEQNDVAVFDDFLDDLLQTLFELAAVFAACDQRGHIEGDHTLARNDIGHLIGHNELRQAFDHGGFAYARLADEQRVVLLAAREHLHHAFDFGRTTDNRIELARLGLRSKVGAELLEHALLAMGLAAEKRHARSHGRRLIDQVVECGTNSVDFDAELRHRIDSAALAFAHNAEQQMFGRNIALAHLHSFTQRIFQHALGARRERDVRARFGFLLAFGHAGDDLKSLLVRYAHAFESLRSNAVRLFRQAKQQMLSAHMRAFERSGFFPGKHKDVSRLVGKFIECHIRSISVEVAECMLALIRNECQSFTCAIPSC